MYSIIRNKTKEELLDMVSKQETTIKTLREELTNSYTEAIPEGTIQIIKSVVKELEDVESRYDKEMLRLTGLLEGLQVKFEKTRAGSIFGEDIKLHFLNDTMFLRSTGKGKVKEIISQWEKLNKKEKDNA